MTAYRITDTLLSCRLCRPRQHSSRMRALLCNFGIHMDRRYVPARYHSLRNPVWSLLWDVHISGTHHSSRMAVPRHQYAGSPDWHDNYPVCRRATYRITGRGCHSRA